MNTRNEFGGPSKMNQEQKCEAKLLATCVLIGGLLLVCPVARCANSWQAAAPSLERSLDSQLVAPFQGSAENQEEAADAQQDKKDADADRQDMMQDLYNEGRISLDERGLWWRIEKIQGIGRYGRPANRRSALLAGLRR